MILEEGKVQTIQGAIYTATEDTRVQLVSAQNVSGVTQTVRFFLRKAGKTPRAVKPYILLTQESCAPIGEIDFHRGDSIEAITTTADAVDFTVQGVAIAKLSYLVHGGFTPRKWNSAGEEVIQGGGSSGTGGGGTLTGYISAGTQSGSLGTVVFANSNGISFGMSDSSQVTASYTVPSTAGLLSNIRVSAGTTSNLLSAITFSNSNGLAFGLNASTITGSYTVPSTAGLISAINVSAGTTSNNLSAITFSNGSGVSFGLNGSVLTASVAAAAGAQTGISGIANSQTTYTSGSVTFSELGAITIRSTTGQQFQFSVNAQSVVPGIQTIAFGNTTFTTGGVTFSNTNGFSFGSSGGQVTASYTVPTQTNQTLGLYAVSNTTGQSSSSTFDARTISFHGAGVVSVGYSGGSVVISAPAAAGDGVNIIAAGTQTANTTGTVVFSNSNDVTFGMSNSSVVTANVLLHFSAGTNSSALSSLIFSNANNVSWSMTAGSGVVANAPIRITAGTGSGSISSLSFAGSNGISFGLSTVANGLGTLTATYTVPTQTVQTQNVHNVTLSGNTSGVMAEISSGTWTLAGGNNITLSQAGNAVTIVGAAGGGGMGIAAGTQTATSGTVVFSDSHNVTWGMSNNSVVTAIAPWRISAGTLSNTVTAVTFSDGSGLSFGLATAGTLGVITGQFALTATAGAGIATTSVAARSLFFSNAGGVSWGLAGSTVTASVGTALTNIRVSAGTSSTFLSAITFADGAGINFGLNGSVITAAPDFKSYYANAPYLRAAGVITDIVQSTSYAIPFALPYALSADFIRLLFSNSVSTTNLATSNGAAFSASVLRSFNAVVYSLGTGASSRSLQSVASGSGGLSYQVSISAAAATGSFWTITHRLSYPITGGTSSFSTAVPVTSASFGGLMTQLSNFAGANFFDIPFANSLSAGLYWLVSGQSSTTSTQSNAGLTGNRFHYSVSAITQINQSVAPFGQPNNASIAMQPGLGSISRAGGGTTASYNLSQVSSSASHMLPYFQIERGLP